MRRPLFILILAFMGLTAKAQTPLSDTQSQEVIQQLTNKAASMQTMRCRFVQEKTSAMLAEPSVAEGTMEYIAPNRLRWEYTEPYSFALVVEGERITKITDGQPEVLEGNSSRMYQGMVDLIMGSATGRNLFDTSVFDVVLTDDGLHWKAEMTPKRRDMKRMFKELVFCFDKATSTIHLVHFVEAGGDVTSIRFEEIKVSMP